MDVPHYTMIGAFGPATFLTVVCPSPRECMPPAGQPAGIWGVSRYHLESKMCASAMHSGAINTAIDEPQAFVFRVSQFSGPLYTYKALTRYGIQSGQRFGETGEFFVSHIFKGAIAKPHVDLLPLPPSPNNVVGFGRAQLNAVLPIGSVSDTPFEVRRRLLILAKEGGADSLTERRYISRCFLVANTKEIALDGDGESIGQERTKVSLVWTDPAGAPEAAYYLVTDLDLHVFGPGGEEWRGNDRVDRLNNVEQAWVRGQAPGGLYCATVNAFKAPMAAQKFSLIATGRGAAVCGATPSAAAGEASFSGTWYVTYSSCSKDAFPESDPNAAYSMVQAGNCLSFRFFASPRDSADASAASFGGLRRSVDADAKGTYPALGKSLFGRISGQGQPQLTLRYAAANGAEFNFLGREVPRESMLGPIPPNAMRGVKLEHSTCEVYLAQTKVGINVQV